MRPEAKTAITIKRSQPIFILLSWEIKGTFMLSGLEGNCKYGGEVTKRGGIVSNRNNDVLDMKYGVSYTLNIKRYFLSKS